MHSASQTFQDNSGKISINGRLLLECSAEACCIKQDQSEYIGILARFIIGIVIVYQYTQYKLSAFFSTLLLSRVRIDTRDKVRDPRFSSQRPVRHCLSIGYFQ